MEDGYGHSFILGSIYQGEERGGEIFVVLKRVLFSVHMRIIELRSIEYLCAWTIIILNEKL